MMLEKKAHLPNEDLQFDFTAECPVVFFTAKQETETTVQTIWENGLPSFILTCLFYMLSTFSYISSSWTKTLLYWTH